MSKIYVKTLFAFLAFVLCSNAIELNSTNLATLCRCNPKTTTNFFFDFQDITSLNTNTFENVTNVTRISLGMPLNGGISFLLPFTFDGMTSLEYLDLSRNKISFIDLFTFRGLTSLKNLNLHGNKFSFLDPWAFRDLTALEYLSLGDNQISYLQKDQFKGLTKLKNLALPFNNLSTINPEVFKGLKSFKLRFE